MRLLALETSCDETSAAVIADGRVLSNVVASQVRLHAEYGGVVPELAAREHLKNLPTVTASALSQAGIAPRGLDAVAATLGPGLPQALLVGARAAQAFAFALQRPFLGVHHHEAHLYSPWIEGDPLVARFESFEPNVSLIVSGGHTVLVKVEGMLRHQVLGATMDDAAGECFDKVGKLLGLPYPGGPVMDRLAAEGRADAFVFPRPLIKDPGHDFSFSGLKTSVRYFLERHPGLASDPEKLRDLCASVQAAIVDVLVSKLLNAARRGGVRCVTTSGGVSCNRGFRQRLAADAQALGIQARFAAPGLCTDNAAMIGMLAERRLLAGDTTGYDVEIRPNWPLETVAVQGA
ncbi:MAG: tRNA (adenosine(37)-N6)-threonylcarbamoyltransferase complex transferase subunit TsaD [Verrucomicrobiales bacterium]|nr:tRNA (adenosine(37)-N6)-threonylcarbamoyltransferase complex transferase subunit TsaD [Verrucomicrobiales bacterium]